MWKVLRSLALEANDRMRRLRTRAYTRQMGLDTRSIPTTYITCFLLPAYYYGTALIGLQTSCKGGVGCKQTAYVHTFYSHTANERSVDCKKRFKSRKLNLCSHLVNEDCNNAQRPCNALESWPLPLVLLLWTERSGRLHPRGCHGPLLFWAAQSAVALGAMGRLLWCCAAHWLGADEPRLIPRKALECEDGIMHKSGILTETCAVRADINDKIWSKIRFWRISNDKISTWLRHIQDFELHLCQWHLDEHLRGFVSTLRFQRHDCQLHELPQ